MARKLKTALIGIGGIGRTHLKNLAQIPETHIVAVSDINISLRSEAEKYGARFYSDYHEMLEREELDFAAISTPSSLHKDPVVAAAKKGIDMFIEKPVATTLKDLEIITETVKSSGVKANVGHHCRFNPQFSEVGKIVKSGLLGKVFRLRIDLASGRGWKVEPEDWRWHQNLGGGPWWQNGVHAADLANWILGDPKKVMAFSGTLILKTDAEDNTVATVDYGNAYAELSVSYSARIDKIVIEAHGDEGYAVADSLLGFKTLTKGSQIPATHKPEATTTSPHMQLMKLFIDALLKETAIPVPLTDGVKACEVIIAGLKASKTGKAVKLPLL
jgi:predicted dehydrogenase